MGVVAFAEPPPEARIVEVGAGTGNFLSLFRETASLLVAIDLTHAMLMQAAQKSGLVPVVAEGERLPLRSSSFDVVACAQMLHHVFDPRPLLGEMARVCSPGGKMLVVDQVSADGPEACSAMTELELVRDPSHALSRTRTEILELIDDAGVVVERERTVESTDRFSNWMSPREFPEDRIRAVKKWIELRGEETQMQFELAEDGDITFIRRRLMVLASRRTS